MRERLEDLGRIMVMVEKLLDLPLFESPNCRSKDFTEWFESLSEETRADFLHQLPYQIREVEDQLNEIVMIARGHDFLNEVPE